ncbi:hypothetical protein PICMEDRAFT_114653 [Pichia membranifaciens NRRL Y-2026]|uniref:Phosphatidylinositol N-acetylglucosaminyltransferase subunit H conserved domain-containing protein n=1 Tax=Pichia membranifaciens NRRL Y-2026 TaxID=763406 RepID=A0A1E3NN43_9ASCO|nr:hypothetical protein PICMEDRAFT_114653 [Pichia membranifaciens NRRL Y-2026]ODQ47529.1 hypothetical protein PICMEDRAFT_114653 [Pichia membranifaciens NRRL Y-2026]
MTNGYILEIRTSSSSPGADEVGGGGGAGNGPKKNMNRTDRLKAQFKGIDSKDNDLALRMNSKASADGKRRRHQGGSEKHGRKSSSHSLDKYIKFTVKRSDRSDDDILNRMTKFMFIFLSVGLFWHVLNNVDPIGKVIGGRGRLMEINDVFWREYHKVTGVLNGRRHRIDERLLKRSEHAGGELGYNVGSDSRIREGLRDAVVKVFLVVEKVFFEMKMGREECFVQDLISLFYLGISVFVINEIYWRIYHEIEESLIIIPHLGVQAESILIKENIWQVLKSVLGLRRLLFNMNPGLAHVPATGAAPAAASAAAPVPPCSKEKGVVINKQFVPMDYVKDIVINEGFKGFEVVFYMTLIMEEGVVVVSGGSEERWDAGHARRSHGAARRAARRADRDRRTGLDVVVDVDRRLADDDDGDSAANTNDDDDGYDGGRSGDDAAPADHDTGYYSGDHGRHRVLPDSTSVPEQTKLKMIVVFPNLLPRRAVLETVFRKSREYLKR